MRSQARGRRRRRRFRTTLAVLAALAIAGVLTSRAVRESRAQAVLDDALVTSRIQGRAGETERRLSRLIGDYGGSSAAWAAHGHLGELMAAKGRSGEARSLWRKLAEEGPDDLAADAEMSLILLDREEGRLDDLAARLERLAETGESRLPEDVLLFELAKTLEDLGRHVEAARIKRFEEVVPEGPRVRR